MFGPKDGVNCRMPQSVRNGGSRSGGRRSCRQFPGWQICLKNFRWKLHRRSLWDSISQRARANVVYSKCFATKSSWRWATNVHCRISLSNLRLSWQRQSTKPSLQCGVSENWVDEDLVAPQDGIDNMTISKWRQCHPMYTFDVMSVLNTFKIQMWCTTRCELAIDIALVFVADFVT